MSVTYFRGDQNYFRDPQQMRVTLLYFLSRAQDINTLREFLIVWRFTPWKQDGEIREIVLQNLDNVFSEINYNSFYTFRELPFVVAELKSAFSAGEMLDACEPGYILCRLVRSTPDFLKRRWRERWKALGDASLLMARIVIALFSEAVGTERERRLQVAIVDTLRDALRLKNWPFFDFMLSIAPEQEKERALQCFEEVASLRTYEQRYDRLEQLWPMNTVLNS